MGELPTTPQLPQSRPYKPRGRWGPAVCTERGAAPLSRCAAGPLLAASPRPSPPHTDPEHHEERAGDDEEGEQQDEQQKVEQQQEQQGGVQVEQQAGEGGEHRAARDAELQVER